jgi:uncharacterized protein YyaL (SSP411 family)
LEAKEVVVVGNENEETRSFIQSISQSYNPNRVLLYKNGQNLTKIAPWTDSQTMIDGKPTAYVCKNFACNLPTNELKLALEQLEE